MFHQSTRSLRPAPVARQLLRRARGLAAARRRVITVAETLEPRRLLAATAGGPYAIAEGQPLALAGAGPADTVSYAWDVNADGVFTDAAGPSPALTWAQLVALGINDGLSTWNVRLRASNAAGAATDSPPATLTVADAAPTLSVAGPSAVSEGMVYTLTLDAADPGADTITAWTINWGDGTPTQTVPGAQSSATHTYANGPAARYVAVSATNEDGSFAAPAFSGLSAGSLHPGFGDGGVVVESSLVLRSARSVLQQPDGKILVSSIGSATSVARYNLNGTLDTTFGSSGRAVFASGRTISPGGSMVLQPDGKIVIGGTRSGASGYSDFALARFHADGTQDTTFGTGGYVAATLGPRHDRVYGIVLQADGKIVAAGDVDGNAANTSAFGVARFNPDGTLDTTYGAGGTVVTTTGSALNRA